MTKVPAKPAQQDSSPQDVLVYIITPVEWCTCGHMHVDMYVYVYSNPCISRMVLLSTPVYIVYIIPLGVFVLHS